MKKLVSLFLALVLIFALSITSMALVSPGGTVYREIYINRTHTGENSDPAERVVVADGESHTLVPGQNKDKTFNGWDFYTEDMKPAVEGKDYKIVKVTLANGDEAVKGKEYTVKDGKIVAKDGAYITVVVKPLVDKLFVSENFKGVKIEFNISDSETLSPATGEEISYSVIAVLSLVILAAGAVAVSAKKTAVEK